MRKFNKTNLSPSEVVYRIWPPEWSSCLNSGLQPLRWKARRHPCPGQSDVGCLSGQWMVAPDGRTQPPRMACDPPLWTCSREMSTIFGVMYRGTRGRGDFGQDYIFPKHAQMRLRGSRSYSYLHSCVQVQHLVPWSRGSVPLDPGSHSHYPSL